MLNVKHYLQDIRHIIGVNSPAQLKMFAYRYKDDDPNLEALLNLSREELRFYLYYLKREILPIIEEELSEISEDSYRN